MRKSRFTAEQIAYTLSQGEAGTPVADACRSRGIWEATFYVWKNKYASLDVSELRKLRQLEAENARLKGLGWQLSADKTYGFLLIAINLGLFVPVDQFKDEVSELIDRVRATKSPSDDVELRIPSDRAFRERTRQLTKGTIVIDNKVYTALNAL